MVEVELQIYLAPQQHEENLPCFEKPVRLPRSKVVVLRAPGKLLFGAIALSSLILADNLLHHLPVDCHQTVSGG